MPSSFSSSKSHSSTTSTLPKTWPPSLKYQTTPLYSPTLTPDHYTALRTPPPPPPTPTVQTSLPTSLLLSKATRTHYQDTQISSKAPPPDALKPGPRSNVKITPISDPSHPAHGQSGLFAARDLKPGEFVLEYLGVVHCSPPRPSPSPELPSQATPKPTPNPDPHAASDYDLHLTLPFPTSLPQYHDLAIDAATSGNEARFINDYRGVRDSGPNAEFVEFWHPRRKEWGMGVWVLPETKGGKGKNAVGKERSRGVRKGEEILVSYGRGFWGARRREAEEEGGNGGVGDQGNEIRD